MKDLKIFAELPSLKMKKLLVNHLGTKVDELFPKEDNVDEKMVGNQQRSVLNYGNYALLVI